MIQDAPRVRGCVRLTCSCGCSEAKGWRGGPTASPRYLLAAAAGDVQKEENVPSHVGPNGKLNRPGTPNDRYGCASAPSTAATEDPGSSQVGDIPSAYANDQMDSATDSIQARRPVAKRCMGERVKMRGRRSHPASDLRWSTCSPAPSGTNQDLQQTLSTSDLSHNATRDGVPDAMAALGTPGEFTRSCDHRNTSRMHRTRRIDAGGGRASS